MGGMLSYLNIPKLFIQEGGFSSHVTESVISNLFDGLLI
jgi:hypothetical protein